MDIHILKCDIKTSNGHVYPKEDVQKAIDLLGDTPVQGNYNFSLNNLSEKSSYEVHNLHLEGDNLVGTLKIHESEKSKALRHLLESDRIGSVTFGASGYGDVLPDGTVVNYRIVSIDCVDRTKEVPEYGDWLVGSGEG